MQPSFARRTQRCLTVALAGGTLLALTGGLAVLAAYAQQNAPVIEAPVMPGPAAPEAEQAPAAPEGTTGTEAAGEAGSGSGTPEAPETSGDRAPAAAKAEAVAADAAAALLSESFDSATAAGAPAGWSLEHKNIGGMKPDWGGWTFHTTAEVTGAFGSGGDRGSFARGNGKFAVVQSDTNRPTTGTFSSTLWAPEVALVEHTGAVQVKFDTHYKQGQAPQTAALVAKFDGGAPVVVANYSAQQLNKAMSHGVDVPAGTQKVQIGWQYLESTNNWFWMIDNVEVAEAAPADVTPKVTSLVKPVVTPGATTTVKLSGLRAGQQAEAALGASGAAAPIAGIPAAAADGTVAFDVTVPASQTPGTLPLTISGTGITPVTVTVTVLNPIGEQAATTEPQVWWDGFDGTSDQWTAEGDWEFMSRQQVIDGSGLDRRHTFTRASGVIAVAETKDAAFAGTLTSAPITVKAGDELELRFDSHFRVRGGGAHAGAVTLAFDKGETVELRALTKEEESAQPRLPFTVPAGAKQVSVAFDYEAPAGAGSWMLDDVQIVKPLAPLAEGTKPEAIVDVFSDVQGANAKLQNQVLPGFRNLEGGRADVVISNGDLTGNGTVGQYDSYLAAFEAGGGNDYATRISTIGNHEFYGSDGSANYIKRFLAKTGMTDLGVAESQSPNKGLWGEVVVDDKLPVLWVGSERHEYHGGSGPFVEIWDEQYN
ncbi:metallophosphoesterase family protein [Leucobacter salsicius]|uniref:metallophosphoesterase family protein n=1 Tax=Leucobacter salsicius TaxID=664638 RepID=UPI000346580F|nr:metallophosphoesterase family protein [Leucobacter salsicius]